LYQPVLPLDKLDEECTFKPSLDTKSRELAETHRIDLYEIGIRKLEEKKSNIEAHEKKKELEELKNCTFTPKILKKLIFVPKSTLDTLLIKSLIRLNFTEMHLL
jgi:hypothetical protein